MFAACVIDFCIVPSATYILRHGPGRHVLPRFLDQLGALLSKLVNCTRGLSSLGGFSVGNPVDDVRSASCLHDLSWRACGTQ